MKTIHEQTRNRTKNYYWFGFGAQISNSIPNLAIAIIHTEQITDRPPTVFDEPTTWAGMERTE